MAEDIIQPPVENARPIPGHDGYWATPDGRVWSGREWRFGSVHGQWLKIDTTQRYPRVALRNPDGTFSKIRLHVAILETFVGPRPKGHDGRHLDCNRMNNAITNLAWGTRKENMRDSMVHAGWRRGANHPKSTISWDSRKRIRDMVRCGISQCETARRFGVTQCAVWKIIQEPQEWYGKGDE